MAELFVGTQGFAFKDWVGPFYPQGIPSGRYLEVYSRQFSTVEIDSTFYGIPRATTVLGWRQHTPSDFCFSVKFPKAVTHERMLVDADEITDHFIRTIRGLGDKLGPLLLQFSYQFGPDRLDDLAQFLDKLPADLRYAVEIRNRDWYDTEICDILAARRVALVLHDLYYMPRREEVTTDFVYIRWLGRRIEFDQFDHIQIDRRDEEAWWAERVQRFLDQELTVLGYFNNHWAGYSPGSVLGFLKRLGRPAEPLDPGPHQPRLL
jgi:uncharacterized protein YecE (DUF72 family)